MALEVKWTVTALEDYRLVVEYLLKEWPTDIAVKFVETTQARIETLSIFPHIGIASDKEPGIRSIVLSKHNKLYYRASDKQIEILNIFDTRQDISKNKYD
jgi:plasmid stabilization system protein ParE